MSISNYMERATKIALPTLIMVAIGSIFYMITFIIRTMFMLDILGLPNVEMKVVASIISIILIYVGGILMYIMYTVAGFMGIGVVKSMGRTGWKPLILVTSMLLFLYALLLVIGAYSLEVSGGLGTYLIVYTIASIFILIFAILVTMQESSYLVNGIILLIASIMLIISILNIEEIIQEVSSLFRFIFGFKYMLEFTLPLFLPISLIIVSIGLVIYDFIKHKPLLNTILSVAAMIFTIDFILKFADISNATDLLSIASEASKYAGYISGYIYGKYVGYMYGIGVSLLLGDIFYGIAGILGLISAILLLVAIVKSFTQPTAIAPVAPASTTPTSTTLTTPAVNIMEEIRRIENILKSLDERLVMGQISEQTYRELREKYTARLEELKKQLSERT